MYEPRTYRALVKSKDLVAFEVAEAETDLFISADNDLSPKAKELIKKARIEITKYIVKHPNFETSFIPLPSDFKASGLVADMLKYSKMVGIGPMAAVAGAVAEYVGKKLLKYSKQVIVENGGDIFIKSSEPRKIGIFAGKSPFSKKIVLEVDGCDTPLGVCTSSGTVGHSFSFGSADAVVIAARSAALADAAATAVGNAIKKSEDIEAGLAVAQKIKGLKGVLIIKDDKMGIWGKMKISGIR